MNGRLSGYFPRNPTEYPLRKVTGAKCIDIVMTQHLLVRVIYLRIGQDLGSIIGNGNSVLELG
jgi:hypothetical protein